MKKTVRAAAVFLLTVVLGLAPAAAHRVPTLFWNDEAWFRDSISPLVEKDSVYYIPADLCAMFDGVSVTMPADNNVLIYNSKTGNYISALIDSGKAAVNGRITETESFRNGGTCYLEAEVVCSALGFSSDYLKDDGKTVAVRFADSDDVVPLADLAEFSRLEDDGEDDLFPDDELIVSEKKTLYIVCDADSGENFSICDALEEYGLDFTCIVNSSATDEDVYYAASHGEFAFSFADSENADALNLRCRELVKREAHAVIIDGTDDGAELGKGYASIVQDAVVNGGTYAMDAIRAVLTHLADSDYCVIRINTSWNGQEFVRLAAGLDSYMFRTANIEK